MVSSSSFPPDSESTISSPITHGLGRKKAFNKTKSGGYKPRRRDKYVCRFCNKVFILAQGLAGHYRLHYPGGKKKNLLLGEGDRSMAAAPRRNYRSIKQAARAAGLQGVGKHQCVCSTCGKGIDAAEVSSKPENQPKLQPPPGFPPLNPLAAPPAALTVASTPLALLAACAEEAPMVPAFASSTSPKASDDVAPPKAPIIIDLEASDVTTPPPSPPRTAPNDTPMVAPDTFPWARGRPRRSFLRAIVSRYFHGLRPRYSVPPIHRTFVRDNTPRLPGQPSSTHVLQPHAPPNPSCNALTRPTARVSKSTVVPSSVSQAYQMPHTAPSLDSRIPGRCPTLLPHLNLNMRSFGSENEATLSEMSTSCPINHQQPNLCASSHVPSIASSSPVVSNLMPGSGINTFLRRPPPLSSSYSHAHDPCGRLPATHFIRELMMDLQAGGNIAGNFAPNGNYSSNPQPDCVHSPMNVPASLPADDRVANGPLPAPPEPSRAFSEMASHNHRDPGIDENFIAIGVPFHPVSCHNCGEML